VALATKGATRGQAAHDTVVTGRRLRWPTSIGTEAQGYLPERAAGLTPNPERRNLHSFISTGALVAAAGGSAAAVEAYAEMTELYFGAASYFDRRSRTRLRLRRRRCKRACSAPLVKGKRRWLIVLLEQGGAPLGTPASECKPHVPRHPH
jgi:hypothetical protein